VVQADPAAGVAYYLTNLTITFSETVSGVDAADLLINGVPASSVTSSGPKTYTFSFPQPAYGPLLSHGRRDGMDTRLRRSTQAVRRECGEAPTLRYTLYNRTAADSY